MHTGVYVYMYMLYRGVLMTPYNYNATETQADCTITAQLYMYII